jgi:hypothetical protein
MALERFENRFLRTFFVWESAGAKIENRRRAEKKIVLRLKVAPWSKNVRTVEFFKIE